jgi:hypothetical protein
MVGKEKPNNKKVGRGNGLKFPLPNIAKEVLLLLWGQV